MFGSYSNYSLAYSNLSVIYLNHFVYMQESSVCNECLEFAKEIQTTLTKGNKVRVRKDIHINVVN